MFLKILRFPKLRLICLAVQFNCKHQFLSDKPLLKFNCKLPAVRIYKLVWRYVTKSFPTISIVDNDALTSLS